MAEYSRIAQGSVVSTGGQTPVVLPFKPDMVRLVNRTAAETPTDGFIPYVDWFSGMGEGAAVYSVFESTPVLETAYTATGGISTFDAGLSLQYGASQQVVSITKADPAVVTVTGHGYVTGDVVIFEGLYQSTTTGMPQIAGLPFVITVTGANTFTIPWNTNQSSYTALSGSPTGASVKKVLYPFLYAPGVSYVEDITAASNAVVTTTAPHNLVVGQEVAFRVSSDWGMVEINSNSNTNIPSQALYGYVVSVGSSTTATISIDSSSFTAFSTNPTVARVKAGGLTPAQMVAVGDVNTGGWPITAGSDLYPSPLVNGVRTINGPAIQGAFINNTRQGFIIGATIAGAASDVIYYEAKLADYSS